VDDPFRSRHEPALTLYEAFQREATKRKGRAVDEWVKAEREAVWHAACTYAQQHGLRIPSLAEVASCEHYAMGSVDYGSKWAYQVERMMKVADGVKVPAP
jgi:hypothetical protein